MLGFIKHPYIPLLDYMAISYQKSFVILCLFRRFFSRLGCFSCSLESPACPTSGLIEMSKGGKKILLRNLETVDIKILWRLEWRQFLGSSEGFS